jgi:hypothetical protein
VLTTKGRRLVPRLVQRLLDVENDVLASAPPAVVERLVADLARLLTSIDPGDTATGGDT